MSTALHRATFFDALQSEWLKQRRSLSAWLVLVGGFFVPAMMLAARLWNHEDLPALHESAHYWTALWKKAWEFSAMFLLPMGTIFATSLIAQIEHRNNAWKQVHALPLSVPTIFFAKLAIILGMLLQYLLLFLAGLALVAVLPALLPGVGLPRAAIPFDVFLRDSLMFLAGCLPIVALQYLLSLRFRNFMVPIGAGFVLWLASLMTLPWKWGWLLPYRYTIYHYVAGLADAPLPVPKVGTAWMALGWCAVFLVAGYALFATAKQKG
jgi:hypothetical protein